MKSYRVALLIVLLTSACGSGSGGSASTGGAAPPSAPGGIPGTPAQLSNDPFTDTLSQHQTAVEPSILASGNTIVAAFQVGRIAAGASDAVGYATSTDGGGSWNKGFVPGLTTSAGGSYDNVTDAVVAYDAAHGVWMIADLVFNGSGSALVVSRSTDGIGWGSPVTISSSSDYDKNWIACDNGPTSPHRGTCYAEWDNVTNGQEILMSRSTDGGQTWSAPAASSDSITGIGGQIAIQPQGNVVVPFYNGDSSNPEILSIASSDGGSTWGASALVSPTQPGTIPVRGETDPQVTTDSNGKIYVAWDDSRFEPGGTNDIVMTSSTDGVSWNTITRISPDAVGSGINHFLPSIAVNPSNPSVVSLLYYSAPANCSGSNCTIQPLFSSSGDSGQSWSAPSSLWPAFSVGWIANTSEGSMVGDYFGIAYLGSTAFPAFSAASAPSGSALNQQIYVTAIP